MELKLFWKPDLANAYLVAEKQPRYEQPIFARVYVDHDHEGFKGWRSQVYVTRLWRTDKVLDESPVGFGPGKYDSFKEGRKRVEVAIIRWFKGMGITAVIEKPTFEKEPLWSITNKEKDNA